MKLLGFLLVIIGAVATPTEKTGLRSTTKENVKPFLLCHIILECLSTGPAVGDQLQRLCNYECSPVESGEISDFSYPVDLPKGFADEHEEALVTGTVFTNIPEGKIVEGKVVFPSGIVVTVGTPPESFEARRRRLTATSGTQKLMVLRISTNDATPDFTTQQYYDYVFDESEPIDKPSLTSQYSAMSFGKLNFVPTQGGVVDVLVDMSINGQSMSSIRDAAVNSVQSRFGVKSLTALADHVVFCIPPGTGTWVGSSAINTWRLVLNNNWCGYISGTIHEMGHNLGLLHANKDGQAYMDFTSYMSAGYAEPYYPLKSFNGANNWQLGWFSDRQTTIDPSLGGQVITLATFLDYNKSNKNNVVLIQVGASTVLQYNRAKGFNLETGFANDRVTVVQQQSDSTSFLGAVSDKIETYQNVTIDNFDGSGKSLIIDACGSGEGNTNDPDWMKISIGFDKSYCSQSTGSSLDKPGPTAVKVPSGMCFSEANTVEVATKGVISMKELRLGDLVKSADGKYARVFSFGHHQTNLKSDFLQIHAHGLSKPLEISKDHLLFVNNGAAVPASTIAIGEMLDLESGSGVAAQVYKIQSVTRTGVYAPFTTSGTIMVSGVAASSYVTLQDGCNVLDIGGFKTTLSMHWLAHVFQSPHRLVCRVVPDYCVAEAYTEDGISKWVDAPLQWSKWLLRQNVAVLMVGLAVAFIIAFIFYLLELALATSLGFVLVVGPTLALLAFSSLRFQRCKKL